MELKKKENKYLGLIAVLSVAIPVVVAILLFSPTKFGVAGEWVKFIPHLNGVLNTATSLALITGFIFIKNKNVEMHRLCMTVAFIFGAIFLVGYVIYHSSAPSTVFGDLNGDGVLSEAEKAAVGGLRVVYLVLLITHIILAAVVVPFVLLAFYFALSNKIVKHKKIVKFTLPIWLFVSVSGVIVYLMIKPYY
ncbi:DUF420 domain-containing protein [Xanthovirga aplysinae]|uniref:DUF420 domain-containing protein n=1 Tax=Xanthovirga aplysinae TaxID=2529853 RepID=UPI0012BCA213|nr:DUF420 domain-containing protein [Xanthovirga aplysinae]MTI30545.1 DUF420 domain-containing protein [Xanthovirga aplysinae]